MIDTLYAYNDWANARILKLAEGLSDDQLDQQRDLGFGSLRATLSHILAAERIWLLRWRKQPNPKYPRDEGKHSLGAIGEGLREVARERKALIDLERADGWSRRVTYRDLQNNEHQQRLDDLLMHVANHGIHHRAQALHFLKHFDRKVPGGIDYLFFRIAYPSTPLIKEFTEPMRQYGMEVATDEGVCVEFNKRLLKNYYQYHDWAIARLIPLLETLEPETLHRSMNMGVGSLHKTLAHLRDAEDWWWGIWNESDNAFAKYNQAESISEIAASWSKIAVQRNAMIDDLNEHSALQVVVANPGNLRIPFRVLESMIQLCGHGTHHRAQLINMLRQLGVTAPGLDYVVWARTASI